MPGATDLAREYGSASRGITAGGYDVDEALRRSARADASATSHSLTCWRSRARSDTRIIRISAATETWRAGPRVGSGRLAAIPRRVQRRDSRAGHQRVVRADRQGFSPGNDPCAAIRNPSRRRRQDFCVQQGVPGSGDQHLRADRARLQPGVRRQSQPARGDRRKPLPSAPWCRCHSSSASISRSTTTRSKSKTRSSTINAQTTLDVCYQVLDANSEPCRAITRLADGQVFEVRASNSNIGSLSVEGVDLTLDYTFGSAGKCGYRRERAGTRVDVEYADGCSNARARSSARNPSIAPASSVHARRRARAAHRTSRHCSWQRSTADRSCCVRRCATRRSRAAANHRGDHAGGCRCRHLRRFLGDIRFNDAFEIYARHRQCLRRGSTAAHLELGR